MASMHSDLEREPLVRFDSRSGSPMPVTSLPVNVADSPAWVQIVASLRGKERLWSCCLAAIVSSLSTLLSGYALGYSSSALLELNELPGALSFNGSVMQGLFGALVPVGALAGGAAGLVADHVGRKPAVLMSAVPNLIGWFLLCLAHYLTNASAFKSVILIGRLFTGVATGWAMVCSSLYITEISPTVFRGLLVSVPSLALTSGLVLVYGIGSITDFPYYNSAIVALGINALFVMLMVWLPESPRYLITNNRVNESVRTMKWLRGPAVNVAREVNDISENIKHLENISLRERCEDVFEKGSLIPFFVMVGIMVFQQFSGVDALLFFAASILQEAGLGASSQLTAVFAVPGTMMIGCTLSIFLTDFSGRKVLLVISGIGLTLSSILLGTFFYLTSPMKCNSTSLRTELAVTVPSGSVCHSELLPLGVVAVVVFMFAYTLGWGVLPWTLSTEIFPLSTRGLLAGLVAAVSWLSAAVVSLAYNAYVEYAHPWNVWWSFGAVNTLGVIFVTLFLPETRGKPLEAISELFRRYKLCKWK